MIPMDKVQRGLALFIDRELAPSLSGWDKVLVAGGAGLAVAKLPSLIAQYPIVSALGVYDKENNLVDIDALHLLRPCWHSPSELPSCFIPPLK